MTLSNFEAHDDYSGMPPDPFSPGRVYINTPGGMALNVVATAEQYRNPSIPRIDTGSLKIGDRLQIELEGKNPQGYMIEHAEVPSMSFGSDDIRSPQLTLMLADGERAGDRVKLSGSSISPSGTLLTPGSVKVGMYLQVVSQDGAEASEGRIAGFSLERRTEDGQYVEVPLNHQDGVPEESRSFAAFKDGYTELAKVLSEKGFDFKDIDEDGLSARYSRLNDRTIVYASNQGFGCGVIPQHEAYTYNADTQQLIGMRYLATKQIAQMVVMQGITPELLAQETFAYDVDGALDWREVRSIGPSSLHRMGRQAPFVTYTWLNRSVERPTISVLANAGVEGMQRLQGAAYYEVNITQTDNPVVSAARPGWWVDDPEEYKAIEVANTTLSGDEHNYTLSFANLSIKLPKDPSSFRNELVEAFRRS